MSRGGLAKAGLVTLAGAVIGASMNFVLAAVVGRGLGQDQTGTFFAVVGVFVVAANILELGADTGLVRTLPRLVALGHHREIPRTILVAVVPVLVIGTAASLALWFGADALAAVLGGEADRQERSDLYRSLAPFVLCLSLLAVLLGGTRGLGGVKAFTLVQNIGVPLGRVALVVAAVGAGAGVVTVTRLWAAGLPVFVVVAAVLLARAVRRATSGSGGPAARPLGVVAREFWGFSVPRAVAAAIEITLEWIDVIVVASLRSPGEAGVYAVVTRCVRAGQLVEYAARVAIGPQVSAAVALGDRARMSAIYLAVTRGMVLLAWPFYVTAFAFAPAVLGLFGPGFASGATSLRILSVGMAMVIAAGALQTVILMGGRSTWQMGNKAAALVVGLTLNLVLVPRFGIEGAAVAWVASLATDVTLATVQARRMHVALRPPQVAPAVVVALSVFTASACAGLAVAGQTLAGLAVHLLLGGLVYVLVLWRWRGPVGIAGLERVVRGAPAPATRG